ncbi:hypothetical protein ACFLYO_08030 [Chloroflexota bacterium]
MGGTEAGFLIRGIIDHIKDRNVWRNPAVAVRIIDPDNPFRYLTMKDPIVEIINDVTHEHADKLVRKYTNEPGYSGSGDPKQLRRIYKIGPQHVFATNDSNQHKRQPSHT